MFFIFILQTTMSAQPRLVLVVLEHLVSTHLEASTANALKVSPWTAQAWSARVSTLKCTFYILVRRS